MHKPDENKLNEGKVVLLAITCLVFLGTILYLYNYKWAPAIPAITRGEIDDGRITLFDHMDAKSAAASAMLGQVSLLVTVLFAVSALFGFAIKDYLDGWWQSKVWTLFFLSLYGWLFTVCLVKAYETYRALALQLKEGLLLTDGPIKLIDVQMNCVLACAAIAVVAFCIRCAAK